MALSKHDQISNRLAKKERTDYNKGKGPDVKGKHRTIEVVTHRSDLYSSVEQVRRFHNPYLATTGEHIAKAIELTKGTGIGVMDESGKVRKRSRSK